jgi:hypothetical protein
MRKISKKKNAKPEDEAAIESVYRLLSAKILKSDFEVEEETHIDNFREARDELDELKVRGLLTERTYDCITTLAFQGARLWKQPRKRGNKRSTYHRRDRHLLIFGERLRARGFSDSKVAEIIHAAIVRKFKSMLTVDNIYKIIRPSKAKRSFARALDAFHAELKLRGLKFEDVFDALIRSAKTKQS